MKDTFIVIIGFMLLYDIMILVQYEQNYKNKQLLATHNKWLVRRLFKVRAKGLHTKNEEL